MPRHSWTPALFAIHQPEQLQMHQALLQSLRQASPQDGQPSDNVQGLLCQPHADEAGREAKEIYCVWMVEILHLKHPGKMSPLSISKQWSLMVSKWCICWISKPSTWLDIWCSSDGTPSLLGTCSPTCSSPITASHKACPKKKTRPENLAPAPHCWENVSARVTSSNNQRNTTSNGKIGDLHTRGAVSSAPAAPQPPTPPPTSHAPGSPAFALLQVASLSLGFS